MAWLIPSVIAAMAGSVVLTLCYSYVYFQDRKSYLKIWAISWGIYCTRYVFLLGMLLWQKNNLLLIGNQLATLISGTLLLYGSCQFIDKKFPKMFIGVSVFCVFWIIFSILSKLPFLYIVLPTFGVLSIIYIWTGFLFYNYSKTHQKEAKVVGISLIAWGIHKANYPFLRPIIWFAPWGYLIAATLELSTAIGLLILYFRKTKDDLQESEERYVGLFNSIRDAILVTDTNREIVECNPAFTDLFGYSQKAIKGKKTLFLYESDNQFQEIGKALRAHYGKNPFLNTVNYKKKNGSVFPGETGIFFLKNSNNETIGYIGLIRDISRQQSAELALQESNIELRLAQKIANIGNWSLDPEVGVPKWSEQIYKIYERDPKLGPYLLTDYPNIYKRVWWETFNTAILNAINNGVPYDIELKLELPSGRVKWVRSICEPVLQPGSNRYLLRGTIQDITTIKQTADELRKSQEQFEFAMDASQDGLFDWNLINNTVYYSPSWKRMLGYEDHELPNDFSVWNSLIKPEDVKRSWKMQQELIKNERGRFEMEFKMKHKNGHWIDIFSRAKAKFDDSGKATRIIGTHVDITKQKQLEANLLQAHKMEAIGTLAGGIAHDFNNILGAILGYAEMVQDDCPAGSPMRSDIDRVIEASHRAKELVKQILAFSRQTETDKKILQPALIIKEAIKMLRSSLPTTIDIKQNIDSETGLILADPTQIHQIITNLCTNAFHAMEETGGTLSISLKNKEMAEANLISEPEMQPGKFIEISVNDTGPGIDAEIMDKIFNPFFTTKEVGKGTGMGLAIIHGIAKKSGGFVSCKSSPGEGTTIHVYLPVHTATVLPEADMTSIELIQTGIERILFIDDEEMLAEMCKTMLERLGYRVTVETNSIEALRIIQSQPDRFDLVITDQTMPGMTGSDLARHILQIRSDMPIILCTGFSNQISEEKARICGIKGYAMKPVTKKDIASLIRKVLDGEKLEP